MKGNTLFLQLSQPVNDEWIHCFQSIPYRTGGLDELPRNFHFSHHTAHVDLSPPRFTVEGVQQIADTFKSFLKSANDAYGEYVVKKKREAEETERRRREREIQEEEKRNAILRNVKI